MQFHRCSFFAACTGFNIYPTFMFMVKNYATLPDDPSQSLFQFEDPERCFHSHLRIFAISEYF